MSGAINYLDRCAPSVHRKLDSFPADLTHHSAATVLLNGDGLGSESVRLTRALGFTAPDTLALVHSVLDQDSIDVADLVRDLCKRYPGGAGGLEVAQLALGDSRRLSVTASLIRTSFGLTIDDVVRAAQAVRAVSIAAVRSAVVRASIDGTSDLRTAGISFDANAGVLAPSSIGVYKLLDRADHLRKQTGRDTITSLDLLRASLPFWSDPTIERLLVGSGMTVEIAAIARSRVAEPGAGHVRLAGSPEREFDLSGPAFRSFLMASEIRDIDQQALTMTHLALGLLLVPGSHLETHCRAALGDGVNLPLLLLRHPKKKA